MGVGKKKDQMLLALRVVLLTAALRSGAQLCVAHGWHRQRAWLRAWMGLAMGCYVLSVFTLVWAYRRGTGPGMANALSTSLSLLLLLLAGAGLYGEHVTRVQWVGVGIVCVGLVVLVLGQRERAGAGAGVAVGSCQSSRA